MKAEYLAISKVFSAGGDVHYVLPHFQREYTWDRPEWATLLEDVLGVYDESAGQAQVGNGFAIEHFLGSIVVIHDGLAAGLMSVFKLVDGQQRLTSVSLMLCALARIAEKANAELSRKIDRMLVNDHDSGTIHYKILPTVKHGDRESYCAIVDRGEIPQVESRIPASFDYFQRELQAAVDRGVDPQKLAQVILTSLQVVVINLDQRENPYRIFESLNGKGKELTQADLIRNYIAMRIPAGRQEQLFSGAWAKVEELLREIRLVGRVPELTAFIRHYLAMETGTLCEEQHVYARFRDRAERQFPDAGLFEAELRKIARFAVNYDQLLRPENIPDGALSRLMAQLNVLEVSAAYPFLLALFELHRSGQLSAAGLGVALITIQNYMVRRYLAGEAQSGLKRAFLSLDTRVQPETEFLLRLQKALASRGYPNNAKLARAVVRRPMYDRSEKNRRRTQLVFEAINRHLSKDSGGYTVLDGNATIEHVMPQKIGPEWRKSLGIMADTIHGEFLHTLGNLTLVTGKWNSELSNAPFEVKRPKLAENALRLNSSYFSQDIPRWGRDEIIERTEVLVRSAVEIWPNLGAPADKDEGVRQTATEAEFHFEVLERIANKVGAPFRRLSPARFESPDGRHRLVGLSSKPYEKGEAQRYWYGFRPSQREFLEWPGQSWLAFELVPSEEAFLLPYGDFAPSLASLHSTESRHWHVYLFVGPGGITVPLPVTGGKLDLTQYRI